MSYEETAAIAARVDAGEAITREEAEAIVRSIARTCKGPYKSEKHRAEYAELREKVGGFGGSERGYDIAALDAVNRNACGADLNEVICREDPFDGVERALTCDKCGLEFATHTRFRLKGRDD